MAFRAKMMVITVLWLLFYMAITILPSSEGSERQLALRLDEMQTCKEYKNLTCKMENIHLTTKRRITFLNFTLIVNEDVDSNYKLLFNLKRCASKEDLDSCENYRPITISNMCEILNSKENSPWAPYAKLIHPAPGCPLKKGVYKASNMSFDISALSYLPVLDWYWILTVFAVRDDNNKIFLCVGSKGQIKPV